jgi:hypothetical protein
MTEYRRVISRTNQQMEAEVRVRVYKQKGKLVEGPNDCKKIKMTESERRL